MTKRSVTAVLEHALRSLRDTSADAVRIRLDALDALAERSIRAPKLLSRYHDFLCFLRAYPDDAGVLARTVAELDRFGARLAEVSEAAAAALLDSGIDGTEVCFSFTYEAAVRLAAAFPGEIAIAWDVLEEPEKLDELLVHLIAHAELETFDAGEISTEDWVGLASAGFEGTDFDWLIHETEHARLPHAVRKQLYDAVEVWVRWRLHGSRGSVTRGGIESDPIRFRSEAVTPVRARPATEIARPLGELAPVDTREGRRLIATAVASIGVRHREVYAFNYGNPRETYLADVGHGLRVLVIGVTPERRFNLEGNYGFVAFKNGVPISYGGASPLFAQANAGVNVYEPFRHGGEAALIFTQVLRTFHALFGNARFVVNAFQFGGDNPEALASGAFWFYWKLGFVPADAEVRALAEREDARRKARRGYRTDLKTLKRLATGDFVLELPGARRASLFPEAWLGHLALGVTERLGTAPRGGRRREVERIAAETASRLGARSRRAWSAAEREAFRRMAPLADLIAPAIDRWSAAEKRALVDVFRKKGGPLERDYARALCGHTSFRKALATWCRRRARAE